MSNHQKRMTTPGSWRIAKKTNTYVTKTAPGPHDKTAMPIVVWLRDHMGFALTMREAKQILNQKAVLVNGRPAKDTKLGIGIFDVISIPRVGKHYRIMMNPAGYFTSQEISAEEANVRLCKIQDKTIVPGGKVQLNLLYGANVLADNSYKPMDTIVLTLNEKTEGGEGAAQERFTIVEHYPFAVGNYAIVIGGRHAGMIGKIVEIQKTHSSVPNRVILEDEAGQCRFDTIQDYVFTIGRDAGAAKRWGIAQ